MRHQQNQQQQQRQHQLTRQPRLKKNTLRMTAYLTVMLVVVVVAVVVFIIALNNYNQQTETELTATAIALIPTATTTPTLTDTPTTTLTPTPTLTPSFTFTATYTLTLTPTDTTIPSSTPTVTFTPSSTYTPTPIPDAVVLPENGVNLRSGPGTFYFVLSTLPSGTFLQVVSRTESKRWLKVKVHNSTGWVIAERLRIYINLDNVVPTSREELLQIPTTKPCINVTGDSVAHGGAIFEIPNIGYARTQMAPVSHFINISLQANGIADLTAIDRSVSAVAISSPIHESYFDTTSYQELLKDRCKFTIIMPWINDLSSGRDPYVAAASHVEALATLVSELTKRNPYGRIVVLGYYAGAPTPFSHNSFARGYTPDNLFAFNQAISQACTTGVLSSYRQVSCIISDTIFTGMGTAYVAGTLSRAQIEVDLITSINDQEVGWMNEYLASKPNGLFIGDGVHLSTGGKSVLGTYLVSYIRSLPLLTPDF